jgi:tRNA(His) 5'-end guanylyltransferase
LERLPLLSNEKFRLREVYSKLIVEAPIFVRVDGDGFHKLASKCGFRMPFDDGFHDAMVEAALNVIKNSGFHISLAYIYSDEISYLILKDVHLPHSGRIEKIVSLLSAFTTSSFQRIISKARSYDETVAFDARIVKVYELDDIIEYLKWRASDCFRNFINAYAQSIIGKKQCIGLKASQIINLLSERGVNINEVPRWQKYGTTIFKQTVLKKTVDKKTGESITVKRRRLTIKSLNLNSDEMLEIRRELENLLLEN